MNLCNISKLIEELKNEIDWDFYFSYLNSTKNQKEESNHDRFWYAGLRHKILKRCSKKITVINQNGRDLIFNNEHYIEIKYSNKGFINKNNKQKRELILEIKLLNSNGNKTKNCLPDTYADFILLIEPYAAYIICKKDLEKFLNFDKPGQVVARNIPSILAKEIVNLKNLKIKNIEFDLNSLKKNSEEKIIDSFIEQYKNKKFDKKNDNTYNKHMEYNIKETFLSAIKKKPGICHSELYELMPDIKKNKINGVLGALKKDQKIEIEKTKNNDNKYYIKENLKEIKCYDSNEVSGGYAISLDEYVMAIHHSKLSAAAKDKLIIDKLKQIST